MTTQPLLLDVPRNQTRLDRWKQLHGVETYCSTVFLEDDDRWVSVCKPQLVKAFGAYGINSEMNLPEIFSHVCRLIDDAGYAGYGASEEIACFHLAESLQMPWTEGLERPRITP